MNAFSKSLLSVCLLGSLLSFSVCGAGPTPLEVEKGKLLFADDFERELNEGEWVSSEKFEGAFSIDKGSYAIKELEGAGHGSVSRIMVDYADIVMEFDFKFDGGLRFNLVLDDGKYKPVWAGHIARVSFSKSGFAVQDDKTGTMNLEIRDQLKKDPSLKEGKLKDYLEARKSTAKHQFENGRWYHVTITKMGDVLECRVGDAIAQVKSEGIDHRTHDKFGPTVIGDRILFDNFKVWEAK